MHWENDVSCPLSSNPFASTSRPKQTNAHHTHTNPFEMRFEVFCLRIKRLIDDDSVQLIITKTTNVLNCESLTLFNCKISIFIQSLLSIKCAVSFAPLRRNFECQKILETICCVREPITLTLPPLLLRLFQLINSPLFLSQIYSNFMHVSSRRALAFKTIFCKIELVRLKFRKINRIRETTTTKKKTHT